MQNTARDKIIRVRLTKEEYDTLNAIVEKKNKNISDYIRQMIFKKRDPHIPLQLARFCAILEEQTLLLNAMAKQTTNSLPSEKTNINALVELARINKTIYEDIIATIKRIPK